MDGILIVNKEKGCTSHDVVYQVKKMTQEKVGHTGTLDPMAQGVLPLLIGKGTLCAKYLVNHDKTYQVELTLGTKTDTADAEGKLIETKEVNPQIFNINFLEHILQSFVGKQEQMPPMYSAIKINGKKLYEYARKGQKIEIEPRKIEIYSISLDKFNQDTKQIQFTVSCSKGTYIRSLCEDIAAKLETVGFMSELIRLSVGEFSIDTAISIQKLKNEAVEQEKILSLLEEKMISIETLFLKFPKIELDSKRLIPFLNGVKLSFNSPEGAYRIYVKNKFIGIGTIEKNFLKRDIIL